jgi:hypothetical protein
MWARRFFVHAPRDTVFWDAGERSTTSTLPVPSSGLRPQQSVFRFLRQDEEVLLRQDEEVFLRQDGEMFLRQGEEMCEAGARS